MTDLKTALTAALNEWEPPTEGTVIDVKAPASTPKRNLTRDTFAMVRDNPGISRSDAVQRLEAMGHKPTSTTSILSQMVRAKMIDEVGGILSTKRKHYTSLTNKLRKQDGVKGKVQAKPEVVAAPKPSEAAPEPQATPVKTARKLMEEDRQRVSNEIDEWLNSVTLRYASLVYERLHYIFGAKK